MKIIEKQDISNWSLPHTCEDCDSKLEVEANDICHTHSERDGIYPSSDSYSACCPVCSHYFCVPINNIPKVVQIEAQNRSARSRSSYLDR